jgi:hypothetical protein
MNKLKLQLDDLSVESFDTVAARTGKGTIFGEQCTCYTQCTCPGCPTCDASCNGTCAATCNGSCDGTCDYTCPGCAPETQEDTCKQYSCQGVCTDYSVCYICV